MNLQPTKTHTLAAIVVLILAAIASTVAGGETGSADNDWPQWRGGPTRDGVVRASPKLLDHWPEGGPTLLWKSAKIEGIGDGGPVGNQGAPVGGCGSVSIAGGKAIFFVHGKARKEKVIFTTDALRSMGWVEGITEELAGKVDKAYRFDLVGKKEMEPYLAQFLSTLNPDEASKMGDLIRKSLQSQWDERISFGLLTRLAKMRDKECASVEDWNQKSGDLLHGHAEHNGEIRSLLGVNGFIWTDRLVCLDAATGKELWKKEFPGQALPSFTYGFLASSTPAIAGGKCYVSGSAGVYCLSVADGALVWQAKSKFSNSSPLVCNNAVFLFDPSGLTAYDAEKGTVLWNQPDARNVMDSCSASLWTHDNKNYLIGYGRANKGADLLCVDPADGKILWRIFGDSGPGYTTPAIHGDMAVAFGKGSIWAFKLTPAKGELAWNPKDSRSPGDERGSSAVIDKGFVYTVGGGYANSGAHCHDLLTGKMKWTQKFAHTETPSPILVDGKIIAHANLDKIGSTTVMFKATPEGYQELGRIDYKGAPLNFWASPTVADGRLYVRMQDCIACYDLAEHGIYLEGVTATKDLLTFQFKQTGGGLVLKDGANDLKDVLITDAKGAAKPANATMTGDTIVVDIKGIAVPFSISYAGTGALMGKNKLPAPAFGWNADRELKYAMCFGQTIVLTSNSPLTSYWNNAANFSVTGAKVTDVRVSAEGATLSLTDRTWKAGDSITLTYPCYQVDQGEPRRETLTFTAPEVVRAKAKFVKTDETTSGGWKGVYGSEGAVVERDPGSTAPKCAVVTPKNHDEHTWAETTPDARALQKSGDAKDRIAACWYSPSTFFDLDIGISDGKEHQVALYLMDWDALGRAVKVEVRDAETDAVLDTQSVAEFKNGKYLIWNIKGQTSFHFISTGKANATVSGVFVDPSALAVK